MKQQRKVVSLGQLALTALPYHCALSFFQLAAFNLPCSGLVRCCHCDCSQSSRLKPDYIKAATASKVSACTRRGRAGNGAPKKNE